MKTKMRSLILICVATVVCMCLCACGTGGKDGVGSATPEKVSEAQWREALGFDGVTNVTVEGTQKADGKSYPLCYKWSENALYLPSFGASDSGGEVREYYNEEYYIYEPDENGGYTEYSYERRVYLDRDEKSAWEKDERHVSEITFSVRDFVNFYFAVAGKPIADMYAEFACDDSTLTYTYTAETAQVLEGTATNVSVALTFHGGKVATYTLKLEDAHVGVAEISFVFSDYGTTKVVLPDDAKNAEEGEIIRPAPASWKIENQTQWRQALDFSDVDNLTITRLVTHDDSGTQESDLVIMLDGNAMYEGYSVEWSDTDGTSKGYRMDVYYVYTPDGNGSYLENEYTCRTDRDSGESVWETKEETAEKFRFDMRDFTMMAFDAMFVTPTADMYADFVCDEETHAYVYEATEVQLWGSEALYVKVTISFLDGKVSGFRLQYIHEADGADEVAYRFSDYGTTRVTVPTDIS